MKGIVLAGGKGTRLMPLTKATNKHLLPIGRKPMIFYPVEKLTEAGITDIMIITGTDHMGDMINMLGSGKDLGCKLTFKVQDEPDGIAGALSLCKDFVGEDTVAVLLGDNIFEESIEKYVKRFSSWIMMSEVNDVKQCMLILKEVKYARRFGVATVENDEIVEIVEKPKTPKSNLCVTGIYFYDKHVFDFVKELSVSDRGEFEITDVNNYYINNGIARYDILEGWWTDAGTFSSYERANNLINSQD